jgi:transcriptional regulator with XRE-family HTH domain
LRASLDFGNLVSPEEIRRTRERLRCTARQLAEALGIDAKLVFAWESGEQFPTKRHVERLKALNDAGSLPSRPAPGQGERPEQEILGDPAFWNLIRKLAAHPDLRAKVQALAASYADPPKR